MDMSVGLAWKEALVDRGAVGLAGVGRGTGPGSPPLEARTSEWAVSESAEARLLLSVKAAVGQLDWNIELAQGALPEFEGKWRTMICLLSFAYASCVFESQAIIGSCRTDPLFREACGGSVPFEREIRQFRRRHSTWIQTAVTQALLREQSRQFQAEFHPSDEANFIDRIRHLAEDRITTAKQMDASE